MKTCLLRKIIQAAGVPFLWLNGDDDEVAALFQTKSVSNFRRLIGDNSLLVIDEAQAIPQIGQALKLMVDEIPGLRIAVSGSSAFDLHNQLGEPLVGRAFWYELMPIAQCELRHHENLLETRQNLSERLVYGSYPEVGSRPTSLNGHPPAPLILGQLIRRLFSR